MKVIITALKAPWPAGTVVGDCVALSTGWVPGWAVGTCKPAPDDAEPVATWEPPAAPVEPEPAPSVDEQLQAALALKDAAEQAAAEAQQMLFTQGEQLQAALAELEALRATKPAKAAKG